MEKRETIVWALLGAGAVALGCTASSDDHVGTESNAIVGTTTEIDTGSPKNDTVISFHVASSVLGPFVGPPAPANTWTEFCTGTLITPRLVVTASHCINGTTSSAANGQPTGPVNLATAFAVVGVDYVTPAPPISSHAIAAALTAHAGIVSPAFAWDDFAIVLLADYELANAYAFHPSLTLPESSSSSCPTGALGCSGRYNQLTGILGYSPFAPLAPSTSRHRFQSTGLDIEASINSGWVKYTFPIGTSSVVQGGDSGGPFWVDRQAPLDQGAAPGQTYRDVVGVAAAVRTFANSSDYASLVHPKNRAWLLGNVVYATSGFKPPPHSSYWYQQHAKSADTMWIGDVDYIGPCRQTVDVDCDHWYDHGAVVHDNCKYDYNPGQEDKDEFGNDPAHPPGTGDRCRACPYGDSDRDGICDPCPIGDLECSSAFGQKPWRVDNCPGVSNADQLNGNALAETANQPDKIWGDVCDPVPHAKPDPQDALDNVDCKTVDVPVTHVVCTAVRRQSEIQGDTVAPHPANATVNAPVPVLIPETRERFCQKNPTKQFDCLALPVINDAQLTFFQDADAERGDDRLHPWHRVTTKAPTIAGPGQRDRKLSNWIYGVSTPLSDWLLEADLDFWTADSQNPKIPITPFCTFDFCLDGSWWLHTETPIGNTRGGYSQSVVNNISVGLHGDSLANAYTPLQPGGLGISYCPMPSLFEPLQQQPKKQPIPPSGFPILVRPETIAPAWFGNATHKDTDFVVATTLGLGVVQVNGTAVSTGGVPNCGPPAASDAFTTSILAPSSVWVSASEPATVGSGPDIVGISQDGTRIAATGQMTTQPWTSTLIDCATTGTCSTTIPARAAFAGSYSRALGGVFVAGGNSSGQVLHDVWFLPLQGSPIDVTPSTTGSPVCTTCQPAAPIGDIYAISYSVKDAALWMVDVLTTGKKSLWRVSRSGLRGSLEVLAVFEKDDYHAAFFSFDHDGATLLTLASQTKPDAFTARLEVMPSGLRVTGLRRIRTGIVLAGPAVSTRGYSYILTKDRKSASVERVRSIRAVIGKLLTEEPIHSVRCGGQHGKHSFEDDEGEDGENEDD